MNSQQDLSSVVCLTPLYQFRSDLEELVIADSIRIKRFGSYTTIPGDEVLLNHFRLKEPDYLVWQEPLNCGVDPAACAELERRQDRHSLASLLLIPTSELFQIMLLFKPGRLRTGESFIVHRETAQKSETWTTIASGRCASVVVDYGMLRSQSGSSYTLESAELEYFLLFMKSLGPNLSAVLSCPAVELALHLYTRDDGDRLDVLNGLTALEGVLLSGKDGELSYRLSVRVATLLGNDASDRKQIFKTVKEFYDLRSKIIHGSPLKPKHMSQFENVQSLREIVRRIILSIMALLASGHDEAELDGILDEIVFDDDKRSKVQEAASKFLHIVAG